jgi:hypothetical protein
MPRSRLNNVYILLVVLQGMLLGHKDNLIVTFSFYYYRRVLITIISTSRFKIEQGSILHYLYSPTAKNNVTLHRRIRPYPAPIYKNK